MTDRPTQPRPPSRERGVLPLGGRWLGRSRLGLALIAVGTVLLVVAVIGAIAVNL